MLKKRSLPPHLAALRWPRSDYAREMRGHSVELYFLDDPATRDDVAGMGRRILGRMDRRFDGIEDRLHNVEIIASNLRVDMNGIKPKIDEMLQKQDRMLGQLQDWAGKWKTSDRSIVTAHDRLGDHERRITELERRGPEPA